jgi:hypothetical protein
MDTNFCYRNINYKTLAVVVYEITLIGFKYKNEPIAAKIRRVK